MATGPDKDTALPGLPAEDELLRQARELLPPLPESEPRPGFARRVALRAADERPRPLGAPWWRWAFGGGAALAAGAAALALAIAPKAPVAPAGGELASLLPAPELLLAQRLELYEDLPVVQDQDALEDLDVVAVLHELQAPGAEPSRPEGKP